MPEFHAEPYIYLPAITHKSALIAWGAFYFRVTSRGASKLVDDQDLKYVHPPRKDSIGACSAPYGPALVEVRDDQRYPWSTTAKTEATNHCWVAGLRPDTEYAYRVFVKDAEWAAGERWDWSATEQALVQTGGKYDNRFRTHPEPQAPAPLTFAVIGDFGVGVKTASPARRQQQIADALAPRRGSRRRAAGVDDRRQHLRDQEAVRDCRGRAPATKTTTGSSPTSSRIATSSIASRCIRPSAITTPTRARRVTTARRWKTTSTCASAWPAKRRPGERPFVPACSIAFATARTSNSSASTPPKRRSSEATACSRCRSTGSSSRRRLRPAPTASGGGSPSRIIRRSAPGRGITTRSRWPSSCRSSSAPG